MIYLGNSEIQNIYLGNIPIQGIYAGDLLIYPTTVTAWSVTPTQIEMASRGGTENIRIASLSAWTISSSESWITFSQNSGDSGRTTVVATIASHQTDSARTATITVTDGTNVSTISVTQEAYVDYAGQYFTMEILTAGTINFKANSRNAGTRTIEYSINDDSWVSIASSTADSIVNVVAGDVVRFRGNNTNYCSQSASTYAHCFSASTAVFNAYGNIMSMVAGDDFETAVTFTAPYVFRNFFTNTKIVDASNLILPATTLTVRCYLAMFGTASMLQKPPKILPATTLTEGCYFNMFLNASALTEAPELSAMTLAENCCRAMFYHCTSLTTAPNLLAPTLATSCYYDMFNGCTNLNYIKCLAVDTSASSPTYHWVLGVGNTGTFVKDASKVWSTGADGVPSGWTVVDNV